MRCEMLPHDAEVVGDEQVGDAELLLQLLEEVEDAGLNRHVERGHRLVEDDDFRLERDGAGDADALALPAAQLMRPAFGDVLRQLHQFDQLAHPLLDFGARQLSRSRSDSARMSRMRMRGWSEASGSWKTIWMSCAVRASRVSRR